MTERTNRLLKTFPPVVPQTSMVWTALVDVGDRVDLGATSLGHRYMIPILGGEFIGAPGHEMLSGTVLPGGADRQLLRSDGAKELDAIYEMQVEDGTVLSIRNRVTVDEGRTPTRYAMSVIDVTAPDGPHDWLNRRLLVGTLQSARPQEDVVIVRAWQVLD